MRFLKNWMMAAALAAFFMPVASQAGDHWIVGTLGCQHYNDNVPGFTHQWNYGGGYEYASDRTRVLAGGYLNSYGHASYYAAAGYTLIDGDLLKIAPAVGVVTGYKSWQAPVYHGVTPMAGVVASVEGERTGANLLVTPYFVALQVKFKLFEN